MESFTPNQQQIIQAGCQTTHKNKAQFKGCVQAFLQHNNHTSPKYPSYQNIQEAFEDQGIPCNAALITNMNKGVQSTYTSLQKRQAFREFLTQRQELIVQNQCTDADTCALLYACQDPSASSQCTRFKGYDKLKDSFNNLLQTQ